MIGRVLGSYRLEDELGAGGMGKVYAATVVDRCPGLDIGTRVALKIVRPHLLEQPGFFRRFLREAEIGASVQHDNVVRIHLADALGAHHFIVMEYVEGQTLRALLEELGRVPEELCRHIGREVASGLAAIHEAGVVHRDLKPENILITPDHQVKVMDLGLARLTGEVVRLSQTGAFVGSLHYAAPESFRDGGATVDERADLHALGLVLYELASGVNPYLADDVPQVVERVLHATPRRLGEINPQLSPFFEEVVHTLLAKEREDRFDTAETVREILDAGEDSGWWRARAALIRATTRRPLRRIRIPRETAVYGREDDLAKLRALFEQAKRRDGQVVLIEGEAGIGKSRLVDELVGRLQHDGDDLNFLFGSYPPGGAATAQGAISTAFREHFGDAGCEEFLTQTPLLVPALDAVLRGEPPPRDSVELTKDSLGTCFVHVVRNLADERPTVILIDDLHFAPEEARALFTSLALTAAGHRVLLIGTMRPGVPETWIADVARLEHTTHLTLSRLGPKDLAQLLEDSFRSRRLAEELSHRISLKSDGNPFFAFEIIRGLRERRSITRSHDGTWVSTGVIEDIRIPSSVMDLVNARVGGLTDAERNLLDAAACWGYEFDPTLVGTAFGMPRIPALQAFAKIEKRDRLVRSSGREYVFDHHQVQEALYGALNDQLREEYHAALAFALEAQQRADQRDPTELHGAHAVDLAEHFFAGARGDRALRYIDAALDHLEAGYLHDQAAQLCERALATPELLRGAERASILVRLGRRLDVLGRRERERVVCEEAERHAIAAADLALAGKAAHALGMCHLFTGREAEAVAAFDRALDAARATGDRASEMTALGSLGTVHWSASRLAEARATFQASRAIAIELRHKRGEAAATGNLGNVLWTESRLDEARQHMAHARQAARELGDRRMEALTEGGLGLIAKDGGRLEAAWDHHQRQLSLAREIGDRMGEYFATGNLGGVREAQSRLGEARAWYEKQRTLAREISHREGEARAEGNLGNLLLIEGWVDRARPHFEKQLAIGRAIGHPQSESLAVGNLGVVFSSQGRLAEALEHYERWLTLARALGDRNFECLALLNVGSTYRRLGDLEAARAHWEDALHLAQTSGLRKREASALFDLATLVHDDADRERAITRHEEALALRREMGARTEIANSLLSLAELHTARGDEDLARREIAEAEDIGVETGVPGLRVTAACIAAALPGGNAVRAATVLRECGARMSHEGRMQSHFQIWRAGHDPDHLAAAKKHLDFFVAHAPQDRRAAMLANVPLHREIATAREEQ